jgi:hypothetical protein
MKMYKDAILGNFLIHAPICMKSQPNEALHKDKKLCNYMCYTKYAPFLRFFKTKKIFVLYFLLGFFLTVFFTMSVNKTLVSGISETTNHITTNFHILLVSIE